MHSGSKQEKQTDTIETIGLPNVEQIKVVSIIDIWSESFFRCRSWAGYNYSKDIGEVT